MGADHNSMWVGGNELMSACICACTDECLCAVIFIEEALAVVLCQIYKFRIRQGQSSSLGELVGFFFQPWAIVWHLGSGEFRVMGSW